MTDAQDAPPTPPRSMRRRATWFVSLLLVLVACSAPTPPSGGNDDQSDPTGAIAELLDGAVAGEIDALVTVTTLSATASQAIVTSATAFDDTPLLVEATATTPGGRTLKLVFYGPSVDTSLLDFSGPMRLRARATTLQGNRVLRGSALVVADPAVDPAATALEAYPFLAAGTAATFTGPAAGTAFELRNHVAVAGSCATREIAGAADVGDPAGPPGRVARGILLATFDGSAPCPPATSVTLAMQGVLHVTAIDTHLGVLLGGPGWVVSPADKSLPAYTLLVGLDLPEAIGFVRVAPRSGVRVLDAKAAAALLDFDDLQGDLVFQDLTGSLSGLSVDDVIVSTPRPTAPHGFLRRVTAITNEADGILVTTDRATLRDAIDSAEVRYERAFTAVDVRQAALAAGLTTADLPLGTTIAPTGLFDPINLTIDRVLHDQDGDRSTTDDQLRITGDLYVAPRVVIDLDCSGFLCSRPDFLAKFELEQDTELELTGDLRLDFDERVQLARIPLPPITVAILVFVPEIVIELAANGEIDVSVEFAVVQSLDLEVGVEFRSGRGWDTIDVLNHRASFSPPEFTADLEAEASIGVEGRLMLYGVAGVSAGLELYAHLEGGIPRDPAWTLTGGLRGDVDVDLDIIVWQEEFSIPVFDTNWMIAEAPDTPPKITKLDVGARCSDGAASIDPLSGFVLLDANTEDAEDGRGQGTVRWVSDVDGTLGTTSGGGHRLDATLALGTHRLTATATDSAGNTDTGTLTIDVVTSCPAGTPVTVAITTPPSLPNSIVVGNPLVLTAETRGGLPGDACCSLDWFSDVEGFLGATLGSPSLTANGRDHTLSVTFTVPVGQTITALTSSGSTEVADSIDLRAIVPLRAPPTIEPLRFTWPDGATAGYEGDTVTFSTAVAPANAMWHSSDRSDVIALGVGGTAEITFGTAGPRTITLQARSADGALGTQSVRVRIDDVLARPR